MNFSIVVCQFEGAPVHVHLLFLHRGWGGYWRPQLSLPSPPLFSKRAVMGEIERLVSEGTLPFEAQGEALVQCGNWPIPPESGRKYPDDGSWAEFLGYKRGHPLGLAGEPLKCQFADWQVDGARTFATFKRPHLLENHLAPRA